MGGGAGARDGLVSSPPPHLHRSAGRPHREGADQYKTHLFHHHTHRGRRQTGPHSDPVCFHPTVRWAKGSLSDWRGWVEWFSHRRVGVPPSEVGLQRVLWTEKTSAEEQCDGANTERRGRGAGRQRSNSRWDLTGFLCRERRWGWSCIIHGDQVDWVVDACERMGEQWGQRWEWMGQKWGSWRWWRCRSASSTSLRHWEESGSGRRRSAAASWMSSTSFHCSFQCFHTASCRRERADINIPVAVIVDQKQVILCCTGNTSGCKRNGGT